jgi:chromosome segregation ATPase
MTDAATIPSRADMDRAAIEKTAADATAQLAQMARDFKSSPRSRVEQLLAQLEALEADLHFLNRELVGSHAAQSHRSALQSQLAVAEAEAATEIREAFSEAQRVENAMNGVVDHVGIETTIDGQIPARLCGRAAERS